jgi:hypothetical protein
MLERAVEAQSVKRTLAEVFVEFGDAELDAIIALAEAEQGAGDEDAIDFSQLSDGELDEIINGGDANDHERVIDWLYAGRARLHKRYAT